MPAYPSFNPAKAVLSGTLSNNNLTWTANGISQGAICTSHALIQSGGKYYWKVTADNVTSGSVQVGVGNSSHTPGSMGADVNSIRYNSGDGTVKYNGVTQATLPTFTAADVIYLAVDFTNGKIWFKKNAGNWNNDAGADPSTNTGGITIGVTGDLTPAVATGAANNACTISFTDSAGKPSGFSLFPAWIYTVVTATGAGSFTIPAGVTSIRVEGWGSGANSESVAGQEGGGGGGAYSSATITVVAGDIIYYNVAVGGSNDASDTVRTWFRRNTNSPTNGWIVRNGHFAAGGPTSASGTDGTLIATYAGGTGAAAQGAGGSRAGSGGGGAAGPDGAGTDGTAGAANTAGVGGDGDGGLVTDQGGGQPGRNNEEGGSAGGGGVSGASGTAGGIPGAGGGGGGNSGAAAGAGARGQIRYAYIDPVFNPTQDQFRFYQDGTESGSTALAAQNTNITRELGFSVIGLRILVEDAAATAGLTTDDYTLWAQRNGTGGWFQVTTTSNYIDIANTASFTTQSATTSRLTGGAGTFVAGKAVEDGTSTGEATDVQITASNHTELLWAIDPGPSLTVGDTLDFRVYRNGAVISNYNVTPRITMVGAITNKTVDSTVTPTFTLLKSAGNRITSSITPTFSLLKSAGKLITKTVTPTMTLVEQPNKTFTVEGANVRTNSIEQSEAFDNAYWSKNQVTMITGQADPLGGTAAQTIQANVTNASATPFIYDDTAVTITRANGDYWTFSLWAKAGTKSKCRLYDNSGDGNAEAFFDLTALTVLSGPAGCTITDVGSSWRKITMPHVSNGVAASPTINAVDAAASTLANVTSGDNLLTIFGAQYEKGGSASSYKKTTGSTVSSGPASMSSIRGKILSLASTPTFTLTTLKSFGWIITHSISVAMSLPKAVGKLIASATTPTFSLVKQTGKLVARTVAPTFTLLKQTGRIIAHAVTPTMTLTASKSFGSIITSIITPTFTLLKSAGKLVTSIVTPTFSLVQAINKTIASAQTPTFSLLRSVGKPNIATTTPASTVTSSKTFNRIFSINLTGELPHRYWRVRSSDTHIAGDYFGITELEMRATAGGADQTTGKVAGASVALSGYPASQAIDDNGTNFWTTGANAPPAGGHWLSVDFGVGATVNVSEVSIKVRPDTYREDPANLFIEWSDNNSAWTVEWSHTGIPVWTAGEVRVFAKNTTPHSLFKAVGKLIAHTQTPTFMLLTTLNKLFTSIVTPTFSLAKAIGKIITSAQTPTFSLLKAMSKVITFNGITTIDFLGSNTAAYGDATTFLFSSLVDEAGAGITLQEGDVIFFTMENNTSSGGPNTAQPTGSDSVSFTQAHANVTTAADGQFISGYKVMGATPDTSMTFPHPGGSIPNGTACIYALRGVNPTNVLDVATTTSSATAAAADPPSNTPVTNGALVIAACGSSADGTDNAALHSNPSGFSGSTNHFRATYGNGSVDSSSGAGLLFNQPANVAVDPGTMGGVGNGSYGYGAATIILRPIPLTVAYCFKQTGKLLLSAITPTFSLRNAIGKLIASIQNAVPSYSTQFTPGGTQTPKTISSTTTPTFSLLKSTGKLLASATTPVVSLFKSVMKLVASTTTPTFSLTKAIGKIIALASTPTFTLTMAKTTAKLISAVITPTFALLKSVAKTIAAASTPTFTLLKQIAKTIAAATTPVPALLRSAGKIITSVTTPVATLVRSAGKMILSAQTAAASLLNSVGKMITSVQTPTFSVTMAKTTAKLISAITTPTFTLFKSVGKLINAVTTPTFSVLKSAGKLIAAATTPVTSLVKSTGKLIVSIVTPVPTLLKQLARMILVTCTPSPSVTKQLLRVLTITTTPVATLVTGFGKIISLATTPTFTVIRSAGKLIAVALTPVNTLLKAIGRIITSVQNSLPSMTTSGAPTPKTISASTTPTFSISKIVGKLISLFQAGSGGSVTNTPDTIVSSSGATGVTVANLEAQD